MPAVLTRTSAITVNRRELSAALTRVGRIVPKATGKPILGGVALEAGGGQLVLRATDLDHSMCVRVPADGELRPCVVRLADLAKRVAAGKAEECSIRLDQGEGSVIINGGRVEHRVQTMDIDGFPPVPVQPTGVEWRVAGSEFREALAVALRAAAAEPTRYAINGVLLEVKDGEARLVATDGRRLVAVELALQEGPFEGRVILPRRTVVLLGKLIERKSSDIIAVFVEPRADEKGEKQPAELCVCGPGWMLCCAEADGRFPPYRDIMPRSRSRFVADRAELIDTLQQVALSTDAEAKSVRFDLSADAIELTAGSATNGAAHGTVVAEFAGGGDKRIITAFNPAFVMDTLKSLPDTRVVVDVDQNHLSTLDDRVCGRPAIIRGSDSERVTWVLMPVSTGLPPSRETLGSNFEDRENSESPGTGESPRTEVPSEAKESPDRKESRQSPDHGTTSAANPPARPRRRRGVEHVWPEIGTRLDGDYMGESYAALVVAAPKLKSGRALQIINGTAMGRILNSMTAAMMAATAGQRQKLGMGKSKKGLPTSGWDFWSEVRPRRMSA